MSQFIINTARVVYLPQEVLAADTALWYLNEAGIAVEDGEAVVLSAAIDGVGAVMVEKQERIERLVKESRSASFISPAQQLPALFRKLKKRSESLSFIAHIESGVVYVAAFDAADKMFLVEAYPYDMPSDVVFILDVLLKKEYDWHLYYVGKPSKECRRLLRRAGQKRQCQ